MEEVIVLFRAYNNICQTLVSFKIDLFITTFENVDKCTTSCSDIIYTLYMPVKMHSGICSGVGKGTYY